MNTSYIRIATAVSAGLLAWAAGYVYFPPPDSSAALGEQRIPEYPIPAAPAAGDSARIDGKALYISACQSCHQPSGQGLGKVFPPLAGTHWVTGDPEPLIQIVLHGMTGNITVNGNAYNGFMPGFRLQFSDEQLSAILNYIRSSWQNQAAPIAPDDIRLARAASGDRTEPWRGEQALHAFLRRRPPATADEP